MGTGGPVLSRSVDLLNSLIYDLKISVMFQNFSRRHILWQRFRRLSSLNFRWSSLPFAWSSNVFGSICYWQFAGPQPYWSLQRNVFYMRVHFRFLWFRNFSRRCILWQDFPRPPSSLFTHNFKRFFLSQVINKWLDFWHRHQRNKWAAFLFFI